MGSGWRLKLLVVDGHNVQITIESFIEGRPLLKANDGALRDLAGPVLPVSHDRDEQDGHGHGVQVFRGISAPQGPFPVRRTNEPQRRACRHLPRQAHQGRDFGGAKASAGPGARISLRQVRCRKQRQGRHRFFLPMDRPRLPHYRTLSARPKLRPIFQESFLPTLPTGVCLKITAPSGRGMPQGGQG